MIELLPVTSSLLEAVLEEGWLDDPKTNRMMGWGASPEGRRRATDWFMEHAENGMLGIYRDSQPVGWLSYGEDTPGSAHFDLFISEPHRSQGIGGQVLESIVGKLLSEGYHRIWTQLTEGNSRAWEFLHGRGFLQEGKRWLGANIDGKLVDTKSMVMTKALWHKRRKEG